MAHKADTDQPKILVLPPIIVGKVDIGRMIREIEVLEDFFNQAEARKSGTQVKLPRTSRLMDEFVELNSLNLLQKNDRQKANKFLVLVRDKSPVIHMSFSADPSPVFTQKLITWLRKELHPQLLLQVGLQPNIGAGCFVRTTNKYFDFSLRHAFVQKRTLLTKILDDYIQAGSVNALKTPPVEDVA